jgi:hypothetical protein
MDRFSDRRVDTWIDFQTEAPAQEQAYEMSTNLGLESPTPEHTEMRVQIGRQYPTWMQDRPDSPKCDLTQDHRRGNKDFGVAFLEKMNNKLF